MNAYRFIGVIGFTTGALALAFVLGADSQIGLWLPETIVAQFRGQLVQHFVAGIGAIASGGYLMFFSR